MELAPKLKVKAKEKNLKRLAGKPVSFRILVDRTFVEIFANKGRVYMPMQAVRDLEDKSLNINSKGGSARIEELTVYEMKSIWP
ncbi:MAG: GH32 C-terminal domain-containing protein [Planctomycetota bacterium]